MASEEIVREGDMDDRFYVVVAGACVMERNGRIIRHIGVGECFGESAYLPGARRAAFGARPTATSPCCG